MPFKIRQIGKQYQVITEGTNNVHGTFPTRTMALSQLRALYANVPEARNKTNGGK